jgi:hypothetical protein
MNVRIWLAQTSCTHHRFNVRKRRGEFQENVGLLLFVAGSNTRTELYEFVLPFAKLLREA